MKLRTVLFLIVIAILPIYVFPNEVKIVNGEETTKEIWGESFSGVVMIMVEGPEGLSSCTATIIDPQMLLTARHCIASQDNFGNTVYVEAKSISVKSGLWCGYTSGSLALGEEVVPHLDADLALIYLNKKIAERKVYPVRDNPQEVVGEKGTIVGYGVSGEDKQDSGTQRWGETTILKIWDYDNLIELGDPSGTCYGDSGGPLFTKQNGKNVVSGVTSFGAEGCSSQSDSYSVQVMKYRNWIEENMEDLTGHDLDNICGDGDIDEGEICEAGDEKDCADLGSYIPEIFAKCNAACDGYDLSVCKDQICGNFRKEGSEVCDDGNLENGDYCSDDCTEIIGECGDNVLQTNEECDDGNIMSNDGCDLVCKIECGNGKKGVNEECDDGNLNYGDGCDEFCKLECGNSTIDPGEECDDGNIVSGDGCDASCVKEPSTDSGCTLVFLNP